MGLTSVRRLGSEGRGEPFGTAFLSDDGVGVELGSRGYREEEYIVAGTGTAWLYDRTGQAVPDRGELEYVTRVLVRRPKAREDFNGVVVAEPLHPSHDRALTWRACHPWIMREGATWVAVTQDWDAARSMAVAFDSDRYGGLRIPASSVRYEIVSDVLSSLRDGRLGDALALGPVEALFMSGWSATGSFCRVFLEDGFHARSRRTDGSFVVDGYAICISSGGAGRRATRRLPMMGR